MKELIVDSNVFIASLIEFDEFHQKSIEIIKKMDNNEYIFHISMIIPIEVGCSIARRVGIKESNDSIEILDNWIKEHKIKIYELNEKRMQEAQKCGLQFKLRGMDAIIVQLTKELNLPLITFDNEIINRAKEIEFYK